MSKNKDIEKKLEKEFEKIKEFKKEKLEKPEIKELKEKPEKREIKEWKEIKEKPERKEFKEAIKEKVEHKEIKELEKQFPDKGGKEIVEQVDPGDIFTLPQARSASLGTEADLSAAAASKPKETDKTIEKIKPEKENLEKVHKEMEKIKPEKEFSKHEIKEFKHEKLEHKELKFEKHELKELNTRSWRSQKSWSSKMIQRASSKIRVEVFREWIRPQKVQSLRPLAHLKIVSMSSRNTSLD